LPGKTKWELVKELDFVGLFFFASGCVLFLLGVNWGGRQYNWDSAEVLSTMLLGILLLVALGFWEAYADLKYPLMPPKLFKRWRKFTMVLVVCFVGGMLYCKLALIHASPICHPVYMPILTHLMSDSMNVLWPRQSQLLFASTDPIERGLYAEAIPLGTIISSILTVTICARVHRERWQLVVWTTVQTAIIGSLASVGLDDKIQAIISIVCLSSTVTPPQLLSFTMLSLGIDDQTDM
jgi:hypothetical protein